MSTGFSEPIPLRDDYSWRLGKMRLQLRDRGSKWQRSWQIDWGDIYRVVEFSRFKLALSICHFHDTHHMSLEFFGIWFRLPFRTNRSEPSGEGMSSWGFSAYFGECSGLHLNWGNKTKILWWPWNWDHVDKEHKYMMADGTWELHADSWRDKERHADVDARRWRETYPYKYMLRSGEVQKIQATVTVERRVWRRKFLPARFPLFQLRKTSIDVKFDIEVGDRAGSWKGGCTACGYDMKRGERPIDTVCRMERERHFR